MIYVFWCVSLKRPLPCFVSFRLCANPLLIDLYVVKVLDEGREGVMVKTTMARHAMLYVGATRTVA